MTSDLQSISNFTLSDWCGVSLECFTDCCTKKHKSRTLFTDSFIIKLHCQLFHLRMKETKWKQDVSCLGYIKNLPMEQVFLKTSDQTLTECYSLGAGVDSISTYCDKKLDQYTCGELLQFAHNRKNKNITSIFQKNVLKLFGAAWKQNISSVQAECSDGNINGSLESP